MSPLTSLLRRRVRELSEETMRRRGRVPEQKLRDVERLQRLTELARAGAPPTRWHAVALLAATFLIAGVLLLLEVKPVEVELELAVTNLAFTVQDRRQITRLLLLDDLTATGFSEALLPAPDAEPVLPEARSPLELRAGRQESGALTLSPVAPPPGSRIELASGPGSLFSLSLKGPEIDVQATLSGRVTVVSPGNGSRDAGFGQGRAVYLRSRGQPLRLEGLPARSARLELLPHVPVRDLELVRSFDEILDGRRSPRAASSILSGRLFNESLNGREIRLRPAQWLELPGARGEIRSLTLDAQGIRVQFHGWVDDIVLGHGPNRRSLLPSRLEWLSERHGLKLVWLSALWLFGVAAAALRWWKNPV